MTIASFGPAPDAHDKILVVDVETVVDPDRLPDVPTRLALIPNSMAEPAEKPNDFNEADSK
jgi:hypothetical protein